MIRKFVLGLVAAATIGVAALAPTAASAHHFGGGFGHGFHRWGGFGHRWGGGFGGGDPCFVLSASGVLVNICE
jgi:Spy/CpxP family protein refolding chaperone